LRINKGDQSYFVLQGKSFEQVILANPASGFKRIRQICGHV
jgi:hypothetical protein